MTARSSKEMAALLAKMDELIGPLGKWSVEAIEELNYWLADLNLDTTEELAGRDDKSS